MPLPTSSHRCRKSSGSQLGPLRTFRCTGALSKTCSVAVVAIYSFIVFAILTASLVSGLSCSCCCLCCCCVCCCGCGCGRVIKVFAVIILVAITSFCFRSLLLVILQVKACIRPQHLRKHPTSQTLKQLKLGDPTSAARSRGDFPDGRLKKGFRQRVLKADELLGRFGGRQCEFELWKFSARIVSTIACARRSQDQFKAAAADWDASPGAGFKGIFGFGCLS